MVTMATNFRNSQDLIGSSRTSTKPRFPCIWSLDDSVLAALRKIQTPSSNHVPPGRGFSQLPISPNAIRCYTVLSSVDNLLTGCERADSIDFTSLVNARNTVQHQILSLPPWEPTMSTIETSGKSTSRVVYECCRLAAILYSTAVVFGMPPHSKWHLKLVRRIRLHLLDARFTTWEPQLSALTIWVLFVSGIAAYRSPERAFFKRALATLLSARHLRGWQAVEEVLSMFLWSAPACEHGAAVLWDSIWSAPCEGYEVPT